MTRFVIVRLLSSVALFFAITLFVFVAFFVLPASTGGPRRPGAVSGNIIVRDTYWSHGSFPHQYSLFVWNFVRHGDLGNSYVNREAVTDRLRRAVPVTLSLVLGGVIVWLLISIPLGILSALRPRSLLDRASTVFVTIGLSAHPDYATRLEAVASTAILDLVSHLYENRQPVGASEGLLAETVNVAIPPRIQSDLMLLPCARGLIAA